MHGMFADARFDDIDRHWNTISIISYGIQTAHDGRPMHDIHAHVRLDDLDLSFLL